MEVIYLYIAFSYCFMIALALGRWDFEPDKVGLVCTVSFAPIALPVVLAMVIVDKR